MIVNDAGTDTRKKIIIIVIVIVMVWQIQFFFSTAHFFFFTYTAVSYNGHQSLHAPISCPRLSCTEIIILYVCGSELRAGSEQCAIYEI